MAKKKWAIVIPGKRKKLHVFVGSDNKISWTSKKSEANYYASMCRGVVVDAALLTNAKTRDKCLRAAGLSAYVKKKTG